MKFQEAKQNNILSYSTSFKKIIGLIHLVLFMRKVSIKQFVSIIFYSDNNTTSMKLILSGKKSICTI